MKIATLITCHNRKVKTITCLEALFQSKLPEGYSLDVFLVDDGSTDGTEQAVRECYPLVNVIQGDGNLFWNGGMRLAFARAIEHQYDFYLFMNDDTQIYQYTIKSLLKSYIDVYGNTGKESIVVGSTQDPDSGLPTYGGVLRNSWLRRLKFTLVTPSDYPLECETMNCNCVLVPAKIASDIGNLDLAFTHSMGDFDYGLRAHKAGYAVWVMGGFAGTCRTNTVDGSFLDKNLSSAKRIDQMMSVKGLPPKEWMTFTRRHAGPFWFVYAVFPYLRMFVSIIFRR